MKPKEHAQNKQFEGMEPLFTIAKQIGDEIPDIPLPDDIDIEQMKKILGEDLHFVTLPIGKVNAEAKNGTKFARSSIEAMVDQVNARRPEGQWGHYDPWEINFKYDPPAVRWLAAQLDEKTGIAHAKLVPLSEVAKNHFLLADAAGAQVGSSIYATDLAWNEDDEVVYMRLLSIDIAPPERVGVRETAAAGKLTRQMEEDQEDEDEEEVPEGGNENEKEKGDHADDQPIAEAHATAIKGGGAAADSNLTVAQIKALNKKEYAVDPKTLEEALVQLHETQGVNESLRTVNRTLTKAKEQLDAIRQTLELKPEEDVLEAIQTEIDRGDELAKENRLLLTDAITAKVNESVKLESARDLIMEMVADRKPSTRKQVERVLTEVLDKESIKQMLATKVQGESGGNVEQTPENQNQSQTSKDGWKKFVTIPADDAPDVHAV